MMIAVAVVIVLAAAVAVMGYQGALGCGLLLVFRFCLGLLLLHRLLLRPRRGYRGHSVHVHPGRYVSKPLIFTRQVKPPVGFGTTQQRSLLATELRVSPVAIFV
jgi:hypothetical protein